MFALICLSGRFISSFRNVFSYSAYMRPPPLPRYKPTPHPLRWHGTVCSNQRSQAFELSPTTERLQVDRGYTVLIKKLFKLNN